MFGYIGIVVFETNNVHPLDQTPLVFVTDPQETWKEACDRAQSRAWNKLFDSSEKASDEKTRQALADAAYAIRNASRVEYDIPTTVNHPGGSFVVRIMVSDPHSD